MKNELELYLKENTDRFNCRWLSKRNPELWSKIVKATSFLPEDALPKQRCWHILNEVYERPKCPTTGEETKWFENRYLTYISPSAKASDPHFRRKCIETYNKRTGHEGHWSSNPEVKQRRLVSFASTLDNHKKQDFDITRAENSAWYISVQKAWTEEKKKDASDCRLAYWVSLSSEERAAWLANVKAGWTEEKRLKQSLKMRKFFTVARSYYTEVLYWTRKYWRTHQAEINPEGHERTYWGYHVDHIYSIRDGFVNNVPPEIVGHWTNLRMIKRKDNQCKSQRSDRTLEETVELYMSNQNR